MFYQQYGWMTVFFFNLKNDHKNTIDFPHCHSSTYNPNPLFHRKLSQNFYEFLEPALWCLLVFLSSISAFLILSAFSCTAVLSCAIHTCGIDPISSFSVVHNNKPSAVGLSGILKVFLTSRFFSDISGSLAIRFLLHLSTFTSCLYF